MFRYSLRKYAQQYRTNLELTRKKMQQFKQVHFVTQHRNMLLQVPVVVRHFNHSNVIWRPDEIDMPYNKEDFERIKWEIKQHMKNNAKKSTSTRNGNRAPTFGLTRVTAEEKDDSAPTDGTAEEPMDLNQLYKQEYALYKENNPTAKHFVVFLKPQLRYIPSVEMLDLLISQMVS